MANFAGAKGLIKPILKLIYYRLRVSICYGPSFSNTLKLLTESQTWSEERLVDYQIYKLKVMLRHCAANVPYYGRLFHDAGFDPGRFCMFSDLCALPLLGKYLVHSHL